MDKKNSLVELIYNKLDKVDNSNDRKKYFIYHELYIYFLNKEKNDLMKKMKEIELLKKKIQILQKAFNP